MYLLYNDMFLIVEISPAHNEKSVPVNNGVMIRFSKDMNVATINAGTFLLRKVNGEAIEATVTYDRTLRRAYLQPKDPLQEGRQYEVSVLGGENGVKTAIGGTMPETKRYQFTTTSDILISEPKDLEVVNKDGHITLSWLQPDQFDKTKDLTYRAVISTSGLDPQEDPGAVVWPLATDSIEDPSFTSIGVSRHLEPDRYYAYVQAYIGSELGAWASTQFIVEPPVEASRRLPLGSESFTFEVVETYPKAEAVHILPNTIKVLFSSDIDMSTVTDESIYILKKRKPASLSRIGLMTDYAPPTTVPFTIDAGTITNLISLTIDPSFFEANSEYTVIVRESIKNTNGDLLGEAHFWSFNTTYLPLYGDPETVREDVKAFLVNIPDKTLYAYMSSASQTALDTVRNTIEFFNEDDFNRNVPRYVKEYVHAQATYELLVNALLDRSANSGTMRILGDLTVDSSRSNFNSGRILAGFKERIKPWLDELHGHHNRGYAKPTTTVRGENAEPYPDYFTRSELKNIDG